MQTHPQLPVPTALESHRDFVPGELQPLIPFRLAGNTTT